jgi:acyl-CoA synthetase (AMP-forming)/AMP-acid ligase II
MTDLVHDLVFSSATRAPQAQALAYQDKRLNYAALASAVEASANVLLDLRIRRGDRVAVYLEKRFETVLSMFGTAAAGGAFVPVNPLFKPEQLVYICRPAEAPRRKSSPVCGFA